LEFLNKEKVLSVTLICPDPNKDQTNTRKCSQAAQIPVKIISDPQEIQGLQSESFDFVISRYGLCGLEDLDAGLKVLYYFLKPGGSFIFLEHVAAESTNILSFQKLTESVNKRLGISDCTLSRRVWKHIEKLTWDKGSEYDIFLHNQASFCFSPHVFGIAKKPWF